MSAQFASLQLSNPLQVQPIRPVPLAPPRHTIRIGKRVPSPTAVPLAVKRTVDSSRVSIDASLDPISIDPRTVRVSVRIHITDSVCPNGQFISSFCERLLDLRLQIWTFEYQKICRFRFATVATSTSSASRGDENTYVVQYSLPISCRSSYRTHCSPQSVSTLTSTIDRYGLSIYCRKSYSLDYSHVKGADESQWGEMWDPSAKQ